MFLTFFSWASLLNPDPNQNSFFNLLGYFMAFGLILVVLIVLIYWILTSKSDVFMTLKMRTIAKHLGLNNFQRIVHQSLIDEKKNHETYPSFADENPNNPPAIRYFSNGTYKNRKIEFYVIGLEMTPTHFDPQFYSLEIELSKEYPSVVSEPKSFDSRKNLQNVKIIEFESNEFNGLYNVYSKDKGFAFLVFDPVTIVGLIKLRIISLEIYQNKLILIKPYYLKEEEAKQMLEIGLRIADNLSK